MGKKHIRNHISLRRQIGVSMQVRILSTQVFLVAPIVGLTLDDKDLAVESLDEADATTLFSVRQCAAMPSQ